MWLFRTYGRPAKSIAPSAQCPIYHVFTAISYSQTWFAQPRNGSIDSSQISDIVFRWASLRRRSGVNIGTSESLSPWEEELIFEDGDLLCPALRRLALRVSAIRRDRFDAGLAETLLVGGLTIFFNPGMDKFSITFSLYGNSWIVPSRSIVSQNRMIRFAVLCLRLCLVPANTKPTAWLWSRPFISYFHIFMIFGLFSHQAVTHSPRILYLEVICWIALEMTTWINRSWIRICRSTDPSLRLGSSEGLNRSNLVGEIGFLV